MKRVKPMKPKTVRIWTVDILRRAWGDHFEIPAKARDKMRQDGDLLVNRFSDMYEELRFVYQDAEQEAMEKEFLRIMNGQPRRRRTWGWKK